MTGAKMTSEWPLRPKTSHFRSSVCSSHVLTPHNASMIDPEAGLGLHQLGGWHCHANLASERPLHPKPLPFPPPACSSHVLTPHNASQNDPEAGLELHQLGGWHCQCNFGLKKASPPQTPPISTSSMLLLCADATQCVPERP